MDEQQVRAMPEAERSAWQQQFQTYQNDLAARLEAAQSRAQQAEREAVLAREETARAQSLLREAVVGRPAGARVDADDLAELRSVVDVRILEKLQSFDGSDSKWENWLIGFEATAGLIGLDEIMAVASAPGTSYLDCRLENLGGDDVRVKAKALWYILIQHCQGKPPAAYRNAFRHIDRRCRTR